MLSFCRNWIIFPFARNDVQLQQIRTLSLWSYKACISFYFASRRWSYIKLWSECRKNGFFWWRCSLHWRREHRNLRRFWLWYYFLAWNSYKITQINRERNYISRCCEKPQCIPVVDTINMSVLLMSSIALISFWPRTFYGTSLQQLLGHSTTIMIDTLYPISTFNQQLTNLEQIHIRCSLHCERWTVKGKDCASALRSFREITYPTDEWRKQLLRLKSWVISGSPERWMEFCRLWWTAIALKCSYLFQLFDFYCLLVQLLLFLKIYFFCFFSFMTLSEK